MKIGIFSDVHGHLDELHKTLAFFDSMQVDKIICCGDLVDKGDQSDAVIQYMSQQAIHCVLGNHDAKAQYGWLTHNIPLQRSSLDYLSHLPHDLKFYWEGVSIYICHANPWRDYSVYVFPTRPQALFNLVTGSVDEDIIILGHTHHPMMITVGDKLLINAGSIYGNRDRKERTCGILTLPQRDFQIYDIDTGKSLNF